MDEAPEDVCDEAGAVEVLDVVELELVGLVEAEVVVVEVEGESGVAAATVG